MLRHVALVVTCSFLLLLPAYFALLATFGDRSRRALCLGMAILYASFTPKAAVTLWSDADPTRGDDPTSKKHEARFKCESLGDATLTPREKAAIALLRRIEGAEKAYIAKYRKLGDLKALADEGLIDGEPRSDGYKVSLELVDPKSGQYSVTTEPLRADIGTRSFSLGDDGVVRFQPGGTAPQRVRGCPVLQAQA
jgi:hypothetical protein